MTQSADAARAVRAETARMRRILVSLIAVLSLAVVVPATTAVAATGRTDGQVIRDWNDLAFAAVRNARASDAAAARLYAMVDTAMYDAVNGLEAHPRWSALVAPSTDNAGDPAVAAATAAHKVLSALFPALQADYDAQLDDDLAVASSPGQAKHGADWGVHVADEVLAARANDGSAPPQSTGPVFEIGKYRGTFSGTQFRDLAPFAIDDASVYADGAPPALDSAEYAAAYNDVKLRGNGNVDDPASKATFDYWALGSGTNQPAGGWLQVAGVVSTQRGLSLADTARLFALEAMALADTVAPTYTAKLRNYSWRPSTAILEAQDDGNDATEPDPFWRARGGSSGSPEFWSGHSSFSAAGAAVLAGFFCDDDIAFTLGTDSGKSDVRTFASFSKAAEQAGDSRVVGGLHFEFSNEAGLAAGRAVAAEVLEREPGC
jgi:hypothetical protein